MPSGCKSPQGRPRAQPSRDVHEQASRKHPKVLDRLHKPYRTGQQFRSQAAIREQSTGMTGSLYIFGQDVVLKQDA